MGIYIILKQVDFLFVCFTVRLGVNVALRDMVLLQLLFWYSGLVELKPCCLKRATETEKISLLVTPLQWSAEVPVKHQTWTWTRKKSSIKFQHGQLEKELHHRSWEEIYRKAVIWKSQHEWVRGGAILGTLRKYQQETARGEEFIIKRKMHRDGWAKHNVEIMSEFCFEGIKPEYAIWNNWRTFHKEERTACTMRESVTERVRKMRDTVLRVVSYLNPLPATTFAEAELVGAQH